MSELRAGEPRGRSVLQRVRKPAAGPRPAGRRGAKDRERSLRRPRRLHGAGRDARPGRRPCAARPLPRPYSIGARTLRRDGREVHRRRGDGALRRAGRARGRSRASGAGGACHPRLGRRARRRAAGADRGQHRRGARHAGRTAERGRVDGRRGRRQHGRASGGGRPVERRPGRRADLPSNRAGDRLPRGGAGRRQGQERADPGLGGPPGPLAFRRRRLAAGGRSARRPRPRARPARLDTRRASARSARRSW